LKRRILVLLVITAVLTSSIYYVYRSEKKEQSDLQNVLSQIGSSGEEVRNIQQKLKNWGYYSGAVDGLYGNQTFNAVMKFQRKNGLAVDGIAGPQTLAALGLPTGTSTSGGPSNGDVNLLAHIIYGEARGEPYTGQVAVGAVILNRTRDSRFPQTLAGVIYQPGAFTAVADGQINHPIAQGSSALKAAQDAMNGIDPTNGCVYYFNPATATNKWIWSKQLVIKIGKHNFCK
jgi:N-acetylmuramoyl-L-alanine amidase